jgi:hypothetical protein
MRSKHPAGHPNNGCQRNPDHDHLHRGPGRSIVITLANPPGYDRRRIHRQPNHTA